MICICGKIGAIIQRSKETNELLQEQLQRKNNKNEGAGLCDLPKGSSMELFADPSPGNRDLYAANEEASGHARLFSNMLESATRDARHYTEAKTNITQKKTKYNEPVSYEVEL